MADIDVFLSHSGAQKPWVTALARNLEAAGKRVFLDSWHLVPGSKWIEELDRAIESSRAGVLVVSPEAMESGWVSEEYQKLKRRSERSADFSLIPVIHSSVQGELPFIGNIHWVDFRRPAEYREAFARLLCGLDRRPPGPAPRYEGNLELPQEETPVSAGTSDECMENVHERLLKPAIVTVLACAGVSLSKIANEMKRHAEETVGSENVIHLAPPLASGDGGGNLFFANLAAQANFSDGVEGEQAFLERIDRRLEGGAPLVLVITSFEHVAPADQTRLCAVLRVLNQRHDRLRILIFGGQRLNEMKYADGQLSLLSHAEEIPWPDPSALELAESEGVGDGALASEQVARAMALSGGHPSIAREILREIRAGAVEPRALTAALEASPTLWAMLTPLARRVGALEEIAELAGQEDLGPASPFIPDPLLRKLYWSNLVRAGTGDRRSRLGWRSAEVRAAVATIVGRLR